MKRQGILAAIAALYTIPLLAEPLPSPWKWSAASWSAATVLDITSTEMSQGIEANPLIPTRSNGKPHAGVYVGKIAFTSGMIALQYIIIKRHPRSRAAKVFSVVNFGAAAGTTAVAARNWRIQ